MLAPGSVSAQTVAIQKEIDASLQQARMYEDIEIMRRLLERKLGSLAQSCLRCHSDGYRGGMAGMMGMEGGMAGPMGGGAAMMMPMGGSPMMPGGDMGMPGMPGMGMGPMPGAGAHRDAVSVDGVHLPGHGVVFQIEVPAMLAMLPSVAQRPEPEEKLSEWEIIRKQLRGEKIRRSTSAKNPHQTSVQTLITNLLAEHGKNFRALGDKEKLTVAITFRLRESERGASGGDPMGGMAMGEMGDMTSGGGSAGPAGGGLGSGRDGGFNPGVGGGPMSPPMPGEGAGAFGPGGVGAGGVEGGGFPGGGLPGLPGTPPSGRTATTSKDHELLADYHIRQGRYDEAARSLLKAIALNTSVSRSSGLQRKLTIAYLMQDQYQRADADAVAKAMAAFKKALEGKKTAAPPPAQRLPLPQRLMISVPRQALQSGSLEGASIEWLRFNRPVLQDPGD